MHPSIHAASGLSGLEPLVGKWHTEGQRYDGPLGPGSPFAAVETYEWLEGGHFLIHRLEGRFGVQPAACVEIFGKKPDGALFADTFYNDGNSNRWTLAEGEHALVLSGAWSNGPGQPIQVRLTMRFVEAGNTIENKWEHSIDGQDWSTFLESRATKAQPLPNASVGT